MMVRTALGGKEWNLLRDPGSEVRLAREQKKGKKKKQRKQTRWAKTTAKQESNDAKGDNRLPATLIVHLVPGIVFTTGLLISM